MHCSAVRLDLDKEDTNNIILEDNRVIVPTAVESNSRQSLVHRAQSTRKRFANIYVNNSILFFLFYTILR